MTKSHVTVKPAPRRQSGVLDALIIGAGFSGLYQLHKLRNEQELEVKVLEAGSGIGGTWYWNRYPGARCDSESHAYCYTFSDDLRREWRWSERYPDHAEIRRYLEHVAERFDLNRDIQLDTRVTAANYDEGANLWRVATGSGEVLAARYLITAVGCLSMANVPDIAGLENFAGRWFHTGLWPHEGVDFKGKRVGLIGTGSTGIQAAPVIAESARHLVVFQRTANYSVPARNAPLSEDFQRYVREHLVELRNVMHTSPGGHAFPVEDRAVFDLMPGEREAALEAAWQKGGLQFRSAFRDIVLDKTANDEVAKFLKAKIRSVVKDPQTGEILADIDHPYGAKRPPIDTDYFETYNRENVTLVDVRAHPIEAITPTGLRTSEKEYPLDIIVFATGYDALTGPLLRLNIRGRGGVSLAKVWDAGPRNYLGLGVSGFPNLFTITGPGSPSVLTNMPVAIEQHVEWISDCIASMRANGIARIEAKPDAMDRWVRDVNEAANATLFPTAHHSWYLGANIPGKPRVFMPYAGGMPRYRGICADVAARGYDGFALSR